MNPWACAVPGCDLDTIEDHDLCPEHWDQDARADAHDRRMAQLKDDGWSARDRAHGRRG